MRRRRRDVPRRAGRPSVNGRTFLANDAITYSAVVAAAPDASAYLCSDVTRQLRSDGLAYAVT